MKDLFKGYVSYSDSEYKRMWGGALVVVDTNILLNCYRYSSETRDKILGILEKMKGRLWLPYQVSKEFFRNKDTVMVDSYVEYNNLSRSIQKKIRSA